MGLQGVKGPSRAPQGKPWEPSPGPASGCRASSVSLRGGGGSGCDRKLSKGNRDLCHLSKVSNLGQEIQGLPQSLGTMAPNGHKIPEADKGILSATGSSEQTAVVRSGH